METLSLDLNEQTAITLIMLIAEGVESFENKGNILAEYKASPTELRPVELQSNEHLDLLISLNNQILEEAKLLRHDTEIIANDLINEKPNKPTIILKPKWPNGKEG